MRNQFRKIKIVVLTLMLISQNILPIFETPIKSETAPKIPIFSNASIPTIDNYEALTETYDLSLPSKVINLENWQNGFSIYSDNIENLNGVSFRFNYSDNSYSSLFIVNPN